MKRRGELADKHQENRGPSPQHTCSSKSLQGEVKDHGLINTELHVRQQLMDKPRLAL